jgi:hypothetical protein
MHEERALKEAIDKKTH